MRLKMLFALAAVLGLCSSSGADEWDEARLRNVAAAIKRDVEEKFYRAVIFPSFADKPVSDAAIDKALADLNASHTGRFLPNTLQYYEVLGIYAHSLDDEIARMFPSGQVTYEGIGIATRTIDGKTFVSHVYDASIARQAGILVGDEILRVDGKPFQEIGSFKGLAGKVATIRLRRTKGAMPIDVPLTVTKIQTVDMFIASIAASARLIPRGSRKIGYVRVLALPSGPTKETLESLLEDGILSQADGLILDLRGRWGGSSSELPDILSAQTPQIRFGWRNGASSTLDKDWRKPLVVLIDEGTRSANEILACTLKKKGYIIVGKKSAGAVLAGSLRVLPDDSTLMLAVATVGVDGERLEGKGVTPTIEVDFQLPYANDRDAQLDEATQQIVRELTPDPQRRSNEVSAPNLCASVAPK